MPKVGLLRSLPSDCVNLAIQRPVYEMHGLNDTNLWHISAVQKLNFPSFNFKLKEESGRQVIWDVVRRKYVVLQPEEWVRQHMIHYLNSLLAYPVGLLSVEKQLEYHGKKWRSDLVAYSKSGEPRMLVECKAPEVSLSEQTFAQAARYNLVYNVPFLLITNGVKHFCCKVDLSKKSYSFLKGIPSYKEISACE